jgi:HK97 family phage portal protein
MLFNDTPKPEERHTPVTFTHYSGNNTESGTRIDRWNVMTIPAAWACFRLISEAVAGLPVQVFDRQGNEIEVPEWIDQPSKAFDSYDFRISLIHGLLFHGNAYVRMSRRDGRIAAMGALDPWQVSVDDSNPLFPKYNYEGKGLTDSTLYHLRGYTPAGKAKGLSTVELHKEAFGLTKAAAEHAQRWFGNAAVGSLLVTAPPNAGVDEARQAANSIKDSITGTNKHGVAVASNGFQVENLSVSNDQSQLLQMRSHQIAEIGRVFGVPASMLFEALGTTNYGTGLSQQNQGFAQYAVQPWTQRMERMYTSLVRQTGEGYRVHLNMDELMRGSFKDRIETFAKGINSGIYTPNEVREIEGFGPEEGGDSLVLPTYMAPTGFHEDQAELKKELEATKEADGE